MMKRTSNCHHHTNYHLQVPVPQTLQKKPRMKLSTKQNWQHVSNSKSSKPYQSQYFEMKVHVVHVSWNPAVFSTTRVVVQNKIYCLHKYIFFFYFIKIYKKIKYSILKLVYKLLPDRGTCTACVHYLRASALWKCATRIFQTFTRPKNSLLATVVHDSSE